MDWGSVGMKRTTLMLGDARLVQVSALEKCNLRSKKTSKEGIEIFFQLWFFGSSSRRMGWVGSELSGGMDSQQDILAM